MKVLVQKRCPHCREPFMIEAHFRDDVSDDVIMSVLSRLRHELDEGIRRHRFGPMPAPDFERERMNAKLSSFYNQPQEGT